MPAKPRGEYKKARNDKWVRYYEMGFSSYAIAEFFDVAQRTVLSVLHKRGVTMRGKGPAPFRKGVKPPERLAA